MNLEMPNGSYIVAVSGGVDSMALLDMLSERAGMKLVVAHFNHGIREDSIEDERLVTKAAKQYGWPLEIGKTQLSSSASEETARKARYNFLYSMKEKYAARAIITAHHQDDLVETALINLLRGTGRRGLTAMAQNPEIVRPLLGIPKKDLVKYAGVNNLRWREDETNKDPKYLRNYIRLAIMPKLTAAQREQLIENISDLNKLNPLLDKQIATMSQSIEKNGQINRQKFINLPPDIANEVVIYCLRAKGLKQFDRKLVSRLSNAIKTAKSGSRLDIYRGTYLLISSSYAQIVTDAN